MMIVLMGYRGSGKSSIGRELAHRLNLSFNDLDEVVRGRFDGKAVAQIWQDHGELAFRAAEVEALVDWLANGSGVLALGGGTPMQQGAPEAMQASPAHRFYLHAPAEVLNQRIHGDPNTSHQRPALTQAGGGLQEVQQVLREREPKYRSLAHHVIDVSENTVDQLVDEITAKLD